MRWYTILGLIFLSSIGVFLFDQFGLWMERRGWIYWRKKKPQSSVLSSSAIALQNVFESGKATHIIEAKENVQGESNKTGSGPR